MPSGTYSREVGPPQSKVAKKVLIACDFCRGRKLRCDGARPACSNCSTREGQTCNYQVLVRRRGPGKAKKGSKAKQGKGITGPGTEGVSIMDSQGTQQVTQQIFRFKTPIQPPVASSENSLLFAGVSGPSPRSRRSPPEESDYLNPELQHRLALHHQRVPTTPGITVAHRQQQPFQNQPHFQAASNVRPHFYPSHPHPQPSSFQQMAYSTGMATNRAGPSSSWPGRGSTAPLTIKSEPESAGFDWTGTSGRPLSQHIASDSLPPEERQIMHPPTELGGGSQPYTSEHYYPSGSGYRYYDDRDPNREEEEGRYQWYYGSRDERSRSPGGMRRIDVENGSLRSS
ncbi:gtp binding protein [Moniliophthora roreri MCA 2997]|uniref:Gtp binding protein n=1 Tax=Moniliophthora roreri (strain MCA 2997) TaxID=1381753 RepID=V2YLC9_MONRO|nr:gtp binding protein [Moniliophthora roreri MCA 2997]